MDTMNKWCFIVNPKAGSGKVAKQWPKLEEQLLGANIDFETVFSKRKMHATELAQQAIENGYRHLVAVGGDGTAHEVVNGIFQQTTCPRETITFCLFPVGTGNDWAKTHNIPRKYQDWVTIFKKGKTDFQDIGFVVYQKNDQPHKRYFINVAGLSYDGYVAKKAEGAVAPFFHSLFYLKMMASSLFQFKVPCLSVSFNDQIRQGKIMTVNIGIGRFSGGGMQLVPHARPNDGLLALTIVGEINPLVVLLVTPLLYWGKISWHPKIDFFQTGSIKVRSLDQEPVWVEADGELLGRVPTEIGILPHALKIIVP